MRPTPDPHRPPFRPPTSSVGDGLWRLALMALVGGAAAGAALWSAGTWLAPHARPVDTMSQVLPVPGAPAATVPVAVRHADFGDYQPTASARQMADWVVGRSDNHDRPFMVLDKTDARVYIFGADGRMRGNSPVLLGLAKGDDSVPGIGDRPIPLIKPEERTTPAGRFVTQPGKNADGEEVVWVDYADAISMHRVRKVAESEHRFARLESPTPTDNRISYGCINVPVPFFNTQIVPTLGKQQGVAYIIPEVKTMAQVFRDDAPVVASVAPAVGGRVTTDR